MFWSSPESLWPPAPPLLRSTAVCATSVAHTHRRKEQQWRRLKPPLPARSLCRRSVRGPQAVALPAPLSMPLSMPHRGAAAPLFGGEKRRNEFRVRVFGAFWSRSGATSSDRLNPRVAFLRANGEVLGREFSTVRSHPTAAAFSGLAMK